MAVTVDERGPVRIVRVREAKLTYPVLGRFFSDVQKMVEDGATLLLLDLREVAYMDSASIGCLMDIHRLLQGRGGVLKLFGLQPRVETMVSMTGVSKIIEAQRDEAEGLAAFAVDAQRGD